MNEFINVNESAARHTHVPNCAFSNQAGNYETCTGIANDEAYLHRQMDAKDFVFASEKTLLTRSVAPSPPGNLPTDANQNSAQS